MIRCEGCGNSLGKVEAREGQTIKCRYCKHLNLVTNGSMSASTPGSEQMEPVGTVTLSTLSWFEEKKRQEAVATAEAAAQVAAAEREVLAAHIVVGSSSWDALYWLLALTLIPLALTLMKTEKRETFKEHLDRTLNSLPTDDRKLIKSRIDTTLEKRVKEGDYPSLDDYLDQVPGNRLADAHLPRDTKAHWGYGILSAGAFLALALLIFPRWAASARDLALIAFFTGTFGVFFLLTIQYLSVVTPFVFVAGGPLAIIGVILMLINLSYMSALHPNSNFIFSFLGFTFGVGLCEELVKAAPLLWYYRRNSTMSWRGACRWGMASGLGFGVAEGISYAADFYNGVSGLDIYLVRFISCVGLHAVWSATVAITIYRNKAKLQGELGWGEWAYSVLGMVFIPMVLHGLYDTLLKKDLNEFAVAVAVISFAWFAWLVETQREEEKNILAKTMAAA